MNRLPDLTDHELHGVLLNALHAAAEVYNDAARYRGPPETAARQSLTAQFEKQGREVRELIDKLEEQSTDV